MRKSCFFQKMIGFHVAVYSRIPGRSSTKNKLGAESHGCKLSESKFKALNRLKKSKLQVVLVQKQKKMFFRYELKFIQEIKTSSAGNRTPVSNVTGWDTHHYTTEGTLPRISSKFMSIEIPKL